MDFTYAIPASVFKRMMTFVLLAKKNEGAIDSEHCLLLLYAKVNPKHQKTAICHRIYHNE